MSRLIATEPLLGQEPRKLHDVALVLAGHDDLLAMAYLDVEADPAAFDSRDPGIGGDGGARRHGGQMPDVDDGPDRGFTRVIAVPDCLLGGVLEKKDQCWRAHHLDAGVADCGRRMRRAGRDDERLGDGRVEGLHVRSQALP